MLTNYLIKYLDTVKAGNMPDEHYLPTVSPMDFIFYGKRKRMTGITGITTMQLEREYIGVVFVRLSAMPTLFFQEAQFERQLERLKERHPNLYGKEAVF